MEPEYTDLTKNIERMQGLRNVPTKTDRRFNLLMLSVLILLMVAVLYVLFTITFPSL